MFTQFVVPSPRSEFIALSKTPSGRKYRKHILNKGPLIHPSTGNTVEIDDAFIASLTSNFDAGVCDIVQVPVAGAKNEHTEDPDRNLGEVIGLETEGNKVFAIIDARDEDRARKLGKTLIGASAMINTDYTDTRTGKKVGPTLLHVAVTNRPYVLGLDDFEEVIAATAADNNSEDETVLLTAVSPKPVAKDKKMTKDEMIATLALEHGIDVPALQASAAAGEVAVALSNTLRSALSDSGMLELSNSDESPNDAILKAVVELAKENIELTNAQTEAEVDALVLSGHILPAKKDSFLRLRRTDPEMFTELVPDEPIVKLSNEAGTGSSDEQGKFSDVDAEIARILDGKPPVSATA